jgi:hypothetical protein
VIAGLVDLDQVAFANASTSVRLSVQWGRPTVIADGVLDFYVAALVISRRHGEPGWSVASVSIA